MVLHTTAASTALNQRDSAVPGGCSFALAPGHGKHCASNTLAASVALSQCGSTASLEPADAWMQLRAGARRWNTLCFTHTFAASTALSPSGSAGPPWRNLGTALRVGRWKASYFTNIGNQHRHERASAPGAAPHWRWRCQPLYFTNIGVQHCPEPVGILGNVCKQQDSHTTTDLSKRTYYQRHVKSIANPWSNTDLSCLAHHY